MLESFFYDYPSSIARSSCMLDYDSISDEDIYNAALSFLLPPSPLSTPSRGSICSPRKPTSSIGILLQIGRDRPIFRRLEKFLLAEERRKALEDINSATYNRSVKHLKQRTAFLEEQRAANENRKYADCTFKPKLSQFAEKGKVQHPEKDYFYKFGKEWQQRVKKKLNKKIEKAQMDQKEQDEIDFAPWKKAEGTEELLKQRLSDAEAAEAEGFLPPGTMSALRRALQRNPHSMPPFPALLREKSGPNPHSPNLCARSLVLHNQLWGDDAPNVVERQCLDIQLRRDRMREKQLENDPRKSEKRLVNYSQSNSQLKIKDLYEGRTSPNLERSRQLQTRRIQESALREQRKIQEVALQSTLASNELRDEFNILQPENAVKRHPIRRGSSEDLGHQKGYSPVVGAVPRGRGIWANSPSYQRALVTANAEYTFRPDIYYSGYFGSELERHIISTAAKYRESKASKVEEKTPFSKRQPASPRLSPTRGRQCAERLYNDNRMARRQAAAAEQEEALRLKCTFKPKISAVSSAIMRRWDDPRFLDLVESQTQLRHAMREEAIDRNGKTIRRAASANTSGTSRRLGEGSISARNPRSGIRMANLTSYRDVSSGVGTSSIIQSSHSELPQQVIDVLPDIKEWYSSLGNGKPILTSVAYESLTGAMYQSSDDDRDFLSPGCSLTEAIALVGHTINEHSFLSLFRRVYNI